MDGVGYEAGCLAVVVPQRESRPDKRREYEESDQQRRRPSEGCLSVPSQSQNAYYFLDKIPSHSPVKDFVKNPKKDSFGVLILC